MQKAPRHVNLDLPLEDFFAPSHSLTHTMKYATVLVEGNKAARAIFSLFTNATSIDDIVYDQVWVMDDELQGNGIV